MLYDTLENLNQYTGLFPNLDKAIDFIEDNDVSARLWAARRSTGTTCTSR